MPADLQTSFFPSGAVQSVTEITRSIKLILENGFSFISVSGEISNIRKPYSGHLYFTLKDETSQIKAVLFKTQQRYLQKDISNGDQVICRGRLSLYEPRGEYQIIIDSVEFSGDGDLQLAFEHLKRSLDAEGLFSQDHKKQIPAFPKAIALITSPTGAALHDFLTIARSRFSSLPVELYPVSVQGKDAASKIASAVNDANTRATSDVIVICRGGGSIEDLWPFNDELLARTVFESKLPIISAIGHEIDYTILDFVADLRAPTPSAAAEAVIPSAKDLHSKIKELKELLALTMTRYIESYRQVVTFHERLLKDPTALLENNQLRLDQLQTRLIFAINNSLAEKTQQLAKTVGSLRTFSPSEKVASKQVKVNQLRLSMTGSIQHSLNTRRNKTKSLLSLLLAFNPKAVLDRGYSIVYNKESKEIVKSSKTVSPGDELNIVTGSGNIDATVSNNY